MLKSLFPPTPSPKKLAQQELEYQQRCLVEARLALAYMDSKVQYHQRAANDLKRMLQAEFGEAGQ